MDIIANSIFVENQEEALQFYTNVLGFKKNAMNLSEGFRWLTLVSPTHQDGTELILEPNGNPFLKTIKSAYMKLGFQLQCLVLKM